MNRFPGVRGPRPLRASVAFMAAALAAAASPARADTVVLKGGRKLANVVVSRNDDQFVVVNPWNSRCPEMTWEIPDKNRYPRDKVDEIVIEDPPLVEYRRRAARPLRTAEQHFELATFCASVGLKEEAERHLIETLRRDPRHAGALEAYGATKWQGLRGRRPDLDPAVTEQEHAWLKLKDSDDLEAAWRALEDAGSARPKTTMERARRSFAQPLGRRDKVPLTIESKQNPGATYCIYVPRSYDPLEPTALVVALHGGGAGGKDETLVTGSGEDAMNFYQDLAEEWGFIVVCPTALRAPWGHALNLPFLDALLVEMKLLYDVDESRIYLTGHSMGGFGTWALAPRYVEELAACAPAAGGGGPNGIDGKGLPTYIYHGTDDPICRVESDRAAAKVFAGRKKADFVYTEIDGVGHGFPDWVRRDIFAFFAGRQRERKKGSTAPRSSFDAKVTRAEIDAFGDPSRLPDAGSGDDASLNELIAALKAGGGGGRAAVEKLAARKDAATARAVAAVLKARSSSVDSKVLAADTLGALALPESVAPLAACESADDYRVLDAAVAALGRTGRADALDPLGRLSKKLRGLYESSFLGDAIVFTEYGVRLNSFGLLADAYAALAAAGVEGVATPALEALERDVVRPVFASDKAYRVDGEEDERFKLKPGEDRLGLARRLRACLIALGDPRGADVLERVKTRFSAESALVREVDEGLSRLRGR